MLSFDGGGVEKINYIYSRASYGTDNIKTKGTSKKNLSLYESKEYKYKVISTLNKVKKNIVYYTNDNTKPTWNGKSFLVPKVIFTQGSGMEMAIIDAKGEYLLTQFAYGIGADNLKAQHDILRAVKCKEFMKFTNALSSSFILNKQIFKYLNI